MSIQPAIPILILSLALCACAIPPKPLPPVTIVQTKLITRLPPSEFLVIPPPVECKGIDEGSIATYILEEHNRSLILENNLIGISNYYKDEK